MQARTSIRLGTPGEIIAAVPQLLGFHASQSLVLIALVGADKERIGVTLRYDLVGLSDPSVVVPALSEGLARVNTTAALLVLIDNSEAPADRCVYIDAANLIRELLTGLGIPVFVSLWAESTHDGARWSSLDEPTLTGRLPSGRTTALQATLISMGRVVHGSRDELAATIAPSDPAAVRRREALVDSMREKGATRPGDNHPDTVDRDLERIDGAIAAVAHHTVPATDDDIVALALALENKEVCDRCLMTYLDHPLIEAAERLWTVLVREAPARLRANAAVLLGFFSYARGDGSLAIIALTAALQDDPHNNLAVLLGDSIHRGLLPDQLKRAVTAGATSTPPRSP